MKIKKRVLIHHVSRRHLFDLWVKNPQWENRAPKWWHLLFKDAKA